MARPSSIRRNSLYNLAGHFFPLLAGLILIPRLIQNLGLERFGLMTIVWAVIGYFSLFDFGLGRTLTVQISQLQARGQDSEINVVFWTSMRMIAVITLLGCLALWLLSTFPALLAGKASPELMQEAMQSLKIMALTLPAITLTAGVKGALEANHQFLGLNLLQSWLGVFNFLIPFLISMKDPRLFGIVSALAVLRYAFLIAHFLFLKRTSSWLQKVQVLGLKKSLPLLFSGGWFTVTNVVGPLMVYFDRFFLAALIPSGLLSYYTTPFEIVNRLLILPSSITRALFPVLASAHLDFQKAQKSYWNSFKLIALMGVLIFGFGLIAGRWGLQMWLGNDFAENSFPVLAILLFGFAVNAAAWCPFHLIQALNRPDLSAKVHLIELPFYCGALYFLATRFGIQGAAWAWALRNLVDLILMTAISEKLRKKLWKPA